MRRSLEVAGEPVTPALAAVSGLLVAAEGRRRVELVERVGPDDAGPELVRDLEDARALLGPDAGRQAVGGVVRLRDGLVGGAEREHAQHRPEDLVTGDAVGGRDVGEDRRREPEAAVGKVAGRLPARGALGLADVGELPDP